MFSKQHPSFVIVALLLAVVAALTADWQRTTAATNTYFQYLPIIVKPIPDQAFDMVQFLVGDQRLYEVQHSNGSQARHQTQIIGQTFFHTKGNELNAEWEELWYDDQFIYRGTDTSPGQAEYYTLRDPGRYGSRWAPRFWRIGEVYERNPLVTFYHKNGCSPVSNKNGTFKSYLLFEAYHPTYTFESGLTLHNVVQLAWLLTPDGKPEERYFYAEDYGLVGWQSVSFGYSYISEIHTPGARPDSQREVIACLDRSAAPADVREQVPPLPYWPTPYRR